MKALREILLLALTGLIAWAGLRAPEWYHRLRGVDSTVEVASMEAVELQVKEKQETPERSLTPITGSDTGRYQEIALAEEFLTFMDGHGAGFIPVPLKKAKTDAQAFLLMQGEEGYTLIWRVTVELPKDGTLAEIWFTEKDELLFYAVQGPDLAFDADDDFLIVYKEQGADLYNDLALYAWAVAQWNGLDMTLLQDQLTPENADNMAADGGLVLRWLAGFGNSERQMVVELRPEDSALLTYWADTGIPEASAFAPPRGEDSASFGVPIPLPTAEPTPEAAGKAEE